MSFGVGCRHCVYICFPLKFLGESKHSVRKPDSKTFEKQATVPRSWLRLVVFMALLWALATVHLNVV